MSIDLEAGSYTVIEEIKAQSDIDVEDSAEVDAILYHDLNNCSNKAICGTQEGSLHLVDLETS